MERSGRVIPFNCLRLNLDPAYGCHWSDHLYRSGSILIRSLDLKLKYLEVLKKNDEYGISRCCSSSLRILLQQKSYQLRSFTSDGVFLSEGFPRCSDDWIPEFPQLEMLDMEDLFHPEEYDVDDDDWKVHKEIFRWLFSNTPNLKKIVVKHMPVLKTVPEEILAKVELKLSDDFVFECEHESDLKLLQTVADNVSDLRMLRVKSPFFDFLQEDNDEPMAEHLPRQQFGTALQRMLRNGEETLETLELSDPYPLARLSYSPLRNLSRLSINNTAEASLGRIWNAIASINFERVMPNLEQVKISIQTERDQLGLHQVPGNLQPEEVNNDVNPYSCTTASQLELEFKFQETNLQPFRILFPHISSLSVRAGSRTDEQDFALVQQISECWPHLSNLEFSVMNDRAARMVTSARRNYDANFLGILEGEVRLLEKQNEDYLRNVHIVPVRPCLLAMSKLRKLRLHGGFFHSCSRNAGRLQFKLMSKVTKFVLFQKLHQVNISVPSYY